MEFSDLSIAIITLAGILACAMCSLRQLSDLARDKPSRYWASIRHVTRALAFTITGLIILIALLSSRNLSYLWLPLFFNISGVVYSRWISIRKIPAHVGSLQFLSYCAMENIRDIRQQFSVRLIDTCDFNPVISGLHALANQSANRHKLLRLARYRINREIDALPNEKDFAKHLFQSVVFELNELIK